MKIGSIHVSIITFIQAALIVVLSLVILIQGTRSFGTMRESWHRDKIVGALAQSTAEGALDGGISACQALIASDPSKAAPRLYLGCLLCKIKSYKEAREAFEQVPDAKNASAEEKALALVGAGCAAALEGSKDGVPNNQAEAEKLFAKSIEFKETPDAYAAQALLRSWKPDQRAADIEALIQKALAVEPAPPPEMLEQLYRLQGATLARSGKATESAAAFARVKAINPENTQIVEAGRNAQLAVILDASLDPAVRRPQIDKVFDTAASYGAGRFDALNAAGLAYFSLRASPDYFEPGGAYEKACQAFKQIIQGSPKDKRAYRNLAAVLEDRVAALKKELTVPIPGFTGEPLAKSQWETTAKNEKLDKANEDAINKINPLLSQLQDNWRHFIEECKPDKAERVDAMTRQLAAYRAQVWLVPPQDTVRRDNLCKQAQPLATELAALDESGRGWWLNGLLLIDKGDLALARTAFMEAAKLGFKSPEMDKLMAALAVKPELIAFGPTPAERQFGNGQLVRATFKTPAGNASLSGVKMEMDGKEVPKSVIGSQVLYLFTNTGADSKAVHTIKLEAQDALGHPVIFPEFSLTSDKQPPEWDVSPPAAFVCAPNQIWTIQLKDATGVDWSSLMVGLKAVKVSGALFTDLVLIREGKYNRTVASINVKGGDKVVRAPFNFASANDLPPGEFKLWIEVQDTLGNKLKDEKNYTVK